MQYKLCILDTTIIYLVVQFRKVGFTALDSPSRCGLLAGTTKNQEM